jgi:hypothetical protein
MELLQKFLPYYVFNCVLIVNSNEYNIIIEPLKGVIFVQYNEAAELRRKWKEKGNTLCTHPDIEREYYLGSDTGDYVCTTCGETRFGREGFRKSNS